MFRPKNYSGRKLTTYECGEIPVGEPWSQFNIRFYVYALSFVVFEVETIFLIPWAVVFKKLGLFGFVEMFVFLAILIVGFLYAWGKRALRWA
ncbi:MAG: NADH-quinone oxidoreductase subunit A [Candidatus Eisenbacteria bacterium]|nr:NADH-quinone oxidoreductase subunit A [Candidatus Eisenbacteria bacterium]